SGSVDQLQPQFPRQREHHVLGFAVEFAHRGGPELLQALDHATHQYLGCGGTGGDADVLAAGDPSGVDLDRAVDQVGLDPFALGQFAQAVGVGTVGRADHQHQVALPREFAHGILAVLGGVADVVV